MKWLERKKKPQDNLNNNQWLDLAYHNLDNKLERIDADPSEEELMEKWGTKWKPDLDEKDRSVNNTVEFERPLNMYGKLNEEKKFFSK